MFDFLTQVDVSYGKNGRTIYGKTKVKWSFSLTISSWGIKWMSIMVPNQTIFLELKEDVYDEQKDEDKENVFSEEYELKDVKIDGSYFMLTQDLCPKELTIPEKGQPYIDFPESED